MESEALVGVGADGRWQQLLAPFADDEVDEVLVNGANALFVVAGGHSHGWPSPFADAPALGRWLLAFARGQGVRLDPLCGSAGGNVQASLASGARLELRWHCLLPPLTQDGPLLALRRHRFSSLRLEDFAGGADLFQRLRTSVRQRRNLLIAGPTGSGKTTLLAALLRCEAPAERVVVIESLAELPPLTPGCVRLLERRPNLEGVGAVSLTRLVQEALRLRPDRLVIGEIRGHEAAAFLEAALTGHAGVMATIHGGSAEQALARLARLAAGEDRPSEAALHAVLGALSLDVAVLERGAPPRLIQLESVREAADGH